MIGRSCIAFAIYRHSFDLENLQVVGAGTIEAPVAVEEVGGVDEVEGNLDFPAFLPVVDEVLCKLDVEVMLERSDSGVAL